jgi:hypothetical protein
MVVLVLVLVLVLVRAWAAVSGLGRCWRPAAGGAG